MQITMELSDDVAEQLAAGQDLARAALEALVAESCRRHRLSDHQAAQILGLDRCELDGFLKERGVFLDYSIEDIERERELGERILRKRDVQPGPPNQ